MRARGFGVWGYLIAAVVILGLLATLYDMYKSELSAAREDGKAEIRLEWAQANEKARAEEAEKANAAATKLEEKRHAAKIVYRDRVKEVDKIVDRPIYLQSCFDADGLCIANAAILGKSADSCIANPAVPGTTGAAGRHFAHYLALDYGNFRELP